MELRRDFTEGDLSYMAIYAMPAARLPIVSFRPRMI